MSRRLTLVVLFSAVVAVMGCALFLLTRDSGDGGGELKVVARERTGDRLEEVTLRTPALDDETRVRVLLPDGYPGSTTRFPVLYLLHGAGGDETFWTEDAGVEGISRGVPMIIVMPDGGTEGFYSDWFNDGEGGPPAWESFHVDELVDWVDSEYRTVDDRNGRAIAGASMGGFGALGYAGRNPGTFRFAASFSAPLELDPERFGRVLATIGRDPGLTGRIWGDPVEQDDRWDDHNPVALADELEPVEIYFSSGNGFPEETGSPFDPLEAQINAMNAELDRRLDRLGIPHVWDAYSPGTHDLFYFRRELAQYLPLLSGAFGTANSL